MCYHYSLAADKATLEERFTAELNSEYEEVYHNDGFTHRAMPVITADEPGKIQLYHWGLIPHWVKTKEDAKKLSNQTLNAVSETIYEKPSFKMHIPKKRCLVLADGFYEWMHVGKEKYPHFIYMKDHKPFAFAGIFSHWVDKITGEVIKTFSILTIATVANSRIERIHNTKKRMPVILKPQLERKWLSQDLMKDEINNLMQPLDDELIEAHTISKLITSRVESSNQPRVREEHPYPELIAVC